MKQLEVQIMGQSYLLGCPDGGDARLLEAVEQVDTAMCKIRDSGKVRARDRIAVLAAINLAFDLTDQKHAAAGLTTAPAASTPADASEKLSALLYQLDQALVKDNQLI
jgi:cell division protein ZapA